MNCSLQGSALFESAYLSSRCGISLSDTLVDLQDSMNEQEQMVSG